MEVVHFIYNEKDVDFLPSGNDNVMVNATQMAKIFGKLPKDFLKNDDTQNFIQACLRRAKKTAELRFLESGKKENSPFLDIKSESDLVDSKQKSGTWMHRILALKFAAWLDPDFEVWVFETIDKIILGHYKEQKEATAEKLRAERDLEIKKQELIEKYPEFVDFLALEGKITDAEKRRLKAIRDSVKQLKLDLFPEVYS